MVLTLKFGIQNRFLSGVTRKEYAPSVRRQSRQRLGCGPGREAGKTRRATTRVAPTQGCVLFVGAGVLTDPLHYPARQEFSAESQGFPLDFPLFH